MASLSYELFHLHYVLLLSKPKINLLHESKAFRPVRTAGTYIAIDLHVRARRARKEGTYLRYGP